MELRDLIRFIYLKKIVTFIYKVNKTRNNQQKAIIF